MDIKVTLYDGSYHDVDSSEMAFKIAGSMALQEGVKKASPVILEPVMKVVAVTPEEFMGNFIAMNNVCTQRYIKQAKSFDSFVDYIISGQ